MKIDAGEISRRLAARVDDVCARLVPGGKIEGAEYCVAGVGGGKGQSLRIHLRGAKAGVWSDFANTTDRGDLLDLWAAVRGIPLAHAIKEAKQYLGISTYETANERPSYARPKFKGVAKFADKPESPALAYLMNERKIPKEVVQIYRVAEGNDHEHGVGMTFPCYPKEGGNAVNAAFIALKRDEKGKKKVRQESNCAPCLFGWQAFPKLTDPFNQVEERQILITEGQIDAMTWAAWQCPVPALSVPNGAGNGNWIDYEWENLEQFQTVYLCFDDDEEGHKGALMVAKRLGIHRCRIVRLPHKDANESLLKGVDSGEAGRCLWESKFLNPDEIKKPMDFRQEVHRMVFPDPNDTGVVGFRVPIFDGRFKLRMGESTLWTGYTGHGKSTLLNQVVCHLLAENHRVAIGSFEIPARMNIKRMLYCVIGTNDPTPEQFDQGMAWLNENLWFYSIIGDVDPAKVLELMDYSVARHGVEHFVVDSMMKTTLALDDYEGQKKFLGALCKRAIDQDVHIHVVGHPTKSSNKGDSHMPEIHDIFGSSSVGNQPDNIISVWRNKEKEKAAEDGRPNDGWPDTVAHVKKQRATGEEPRYKLHFHQRTNRYTQNIDEETKKPVFPRFL